MFHVNASWFLKLEHQHSGTNNWQKETNPNKQKCFNFMTILSSILGWNEQKFFNFITIFVINHWQKDEKHDLDIGVNQWFPHLIHNGARLGFPQFESTFNNSEFCCCGIRTTKCCPVIYCHASSYHLTTAVHSPSQQRNLKKCCKFSHVFNGCMGMNLHSIQ